MQNSFEGVDEAGLLFDFGNERKQHLTQVHWVFVFQGNVHKGEHGGFGVQTDQFHMMGFIKNPERMNVFKKIHVFVGDDSFVGDGESHKAGLFLQVDIADDANQNESNGHNWAIGKHRIGDDGQQESSCQKIPAIGFFINFKFWRLPLVQNFTSRFFGIFSFLFSKIFLWGLRWRIWWDAPTVFFWFFNKLSQVNWHRFFRCYFY